MAGFSIVAWEPCRFFYFDLLDPNLKGLKLNGEYKTINFLMGCHERNHFFS